jgi:hypothetical protein
LATAGTTNTGGGGGGSGGTPTIAVGLPGGSGIVIIKYANTFRTPTISGGLTYSLTNSGGNYIYTFTAGTGTIGW